MFCVVAVVRPVSDPAILSLVRQSLMSNNQVVNIEVETDAGREWFGARTHACCCNDVERRYCDDPCRPVVGTERRILLRWALVGLWAKRTRA